MRNFGSSNITVGAAETATKHAKIVETNQMDCASPNLNPALYQDLINFECEFQLNSRRTEVLDYISQKSNRQETLKHDQQVYDEPHGVIGRGEFQREVEKIFHTLEYSINQLIKKGNCHKIYVHGVFMGELEIQVRNFGSFKIEADPESQTITIESPSSGLHCFELRERQWRDPLSGNSLLIQLRIDFSSIPDLCGFLVF